MNQIFKIAGFIIFIIGLYILLKNNMEIGVALIIPSIIIIGIGYIIEYLDAILLILTKNKKP